MNPLNHQEQRRVKEKLIKMSTWKKNTEKDLDIIRQHKKLTVAVTNFGTVSNTETTIIKKEMNIAALELK